MSVQILEIAGEKMAMLPIADYERLLEIAEEQSDIQAAIAAEKRRLEGEEYVPSELVYAIMDGENPLKVWRKYRGLSLDALATETKTSKSILSLIENGKAQGKPALWRSLALALNVTIEDILPDS
jgi:DNA-binding XRE family transcriptional regulator